MITQNQRKIIRMLFSAVGEDYSINEIARKGNLAPNGAFKILKRLEEEGILNAKKIANIKSYKLNFDNEKTKNILELALIPELNKRLKFRADDLKQLRELTLVCIVFGSYTDLKKEPNDLDILFILDKEKFKLFKNKSAEVYKTIPIKVHDILQTKEDFSANLYRKDTVVLKILRTGTILWGYKEIINLIEKNER